MRTLAATVALTLALALSARAETPPPRIGSVPLAPAQLSPSTAPPFAAESTTGGPLVVVSDRDVVQSAVDGSPDLTIVRIQREAFTLEARRQTALLWTPVLTLDTSWRQSRTPTESYLRASSGVIDETTLDVLGVLAGRTSFGTTYEVRFDNRRDTTSAYTDFFPFSPMYRSLLTLTVVQPILRGRSRDVNLAQITVAERSGAAAKHEGSRVAEQLVDDVAERYYAWAGKLEEVRVLEGALDLARRQREATALKIKGGGLSPLDIAQADATVAARESDIITVDREGRDAEREMLRLAYLQLRPGFRWDTTLRPSGELRAPVETVDLDESIRRALEARPEIKRQEELIHAQQAVVASASAAKLWRLDVRAQLGSLGLSGDPNPAGPSPLDSLANPTPVDARTLFPGQGPFVPNKQLYGGFFTALSNPYVMGTFFYLVGVTLEIPLSNAQRDAEFAQAEAELSRRKAELERARAEIAVAVRAAVLQYRADLERVRVGAEAVRLAEVNLDAEQRKFKGGASTTFDVLRVQAEVANARLALVRATVQLNISLLRLERERGTLLARFGIESGK